MRGGSGWRARLEWCIDFANGVFGMDLDLDLQVIPII